MPLPKQVKTQEVLNLIPPTKDIDLLSEKSSNSSMMVMSILRVFFPKQVLLLQSLEV